MNQKETLQCLRSLRAHLTGEVEGIKRKRSLTPEQMKNLRAEKTNQLIALNMAIDAMVRLNQDSFPITLREAPLVADGLDILQPDISLEKSRAIVLANRIRAWLDDFKSEETVT